MTFDKRRNFPDAFSLEDAFNRIKEIQTLLQEGQLSFEESLRLFEEAEQLIRQSQLYLSQAEVRIQHLTGNSNET